MARDLCFEIGTEEMPAKLISKIREDYQRVFQEILNNNRLEYENIAVFSTPRRLTLYLEKLAEKQIDEKSSVRGPATKIAFSQQGEPTKAALGFAKGQGISVDDLVIKGEYVFAEKLKQGKKTSDLLNNILLEGVKKLKLPKTMRWGNNNFKFIRPIKWLLALYGEKLIELSLAGVETKKYSLGHPFLAKGKINILQAEDYFKELEKAGVIVNQFKRSEMILEQIKALDIDSAQVFITEELLAEVTELLEYPTAFYGTYHQEYLKLPQEVLKSSMAEHQRYFPVIDKKENLLPYFVAVRDGGSQYLEKVRQGNEMVLRARLADAQFFFQEDLKFGLEARQEKLKELVYQKDLGTMYAKVLRMKKLAELICQHLALKQAEIENILRAVEISKNDLVSEMVNEFPDLQGIMGAKYAQIKGEKEAVVSAIYEQYFPRFPGDKLPATFAGQIVSIVDKLDNIAAHFSLDLIPTGSQDPFALRRQATAIVQIILENNLKISLDTVINNSLEVLNINNEKLFKKIKDFLLQRMNKVLKEKEIRYDIIDAVIKANNNDLNSIEARAKAVMELRAENPELFTALIRGLVRAKNISSKTKFHAKINPDYLQKTAEKKLYTSYLQVKKEINNKFKKGQYLEGLKQVVTLKEPIDHFLDNVIVMVEDEKIKNNRLMLLKELSSLVEEIFLIEEIILD